MYFWTADQHFGHANVLRFSNRPFDDLHHMHKELTKRHNEVVSPQDITIHVGDFALVNNKAKAYEYLSKLNGQHILLRGSHDKWMDKTYHEIWEKTIEGKHIIACHYAMLTFPRSHYDSWQVFGHSHGRLQHPLLGKQYDVGVDNNDYYPVSFEQLKEIMSGLPDNFNSLKNRKN